MNFKLLLFVFILSSCGVKAPPKPKNDNFPSFVDKNKKVLRPTSNSTQEKTKKKESK